VLVHFTAPWCNTCKQLVPIIEEIAEEFQGKVKAGKLDVDVSRLIAERYQIRSLPTCMVFRGGRKTGEVLGLTTRSRLAKLLGV
jgi:thioredoxin 1